MGFANPFTTDEFGREGSDSALYNHSKNLRSNVRQILRGYRALCKKRRAPISCEQVLIKREDAMDDSDRLSAQDELWFNVHSMNFFNRKLFENLNGCVEHYFFNVFC